MTNAEQLAQDRRDREGAIIEDIVKCPDMLELKDLWCFGSRENNEYADASCVAYFKAAVARLRPLNQAKPPVQTGGDGDDRASLIAELQAKVAALASRVGATEAREEVKEEVKNEEPRKSGRRYQLLKTDVGWTDKLQVKGIMAIIEAHCAVGEVMDEEDIVRALDANKHILGDTVQTGKRLWAYYHGDHHLGLVAHGNLKRV